MELGSKLRWILVIFILLFTLIFVGWGLSAIARNIFNRPDTQVEDAESTARPSLDGITSVRYIVDGPVVATTDQRRYIIEVTPNAVTMRLYSDYGQKVIKEKTYSNNFAAYDAFLESLEEANAAARYSGTTEEDDSADQGVCPDGRRYIIEIGDDTRRWTTSCNRKDGTAAGKMTTMRTLFSKQVPDFKDMISGTTLGRQ